ncbi:transporter substrate-binding domain-containing protein [Helicobacter turcicus]|uniref:Transporter substrate-binding domain-containing protein n=1 Tax=Helicobacter turcicus TaxID=2867412 RepID=A0ABS7JL87_9HELI|nr:transporter substrate-binding domain-containing protein [Helicobacter turcicus]MBX7490167.1 transporter substrate-binding domain-containing protein [Helicobacter turcicus]MBX7545025.1 transporter substrate-binding domain-containing protein [Helicobacter turcicus]
MYRLVLFGILVAFVSLGISGCKGDEKLVVATAAEFPPFEYKEGPEYKGVDMEISQEIAKRLGKKLEIKDMEFDSVMSAVSSGNADFAASGLTINATRLKVADFTKPYYNANQVVIIKSENAELKAVGGDAEALIATISKKNKIKIGVQTGTTGVFFAKGDKDWGFVGFSNAEVKSFVNGSLAVSALVNGQVDIVILDEAPAKLISKANAGTEVLLASLTQEQYGIAVKKGNKELLDSINNVLDAMKKDGTLESIIQKYFK